MNMVRGKNNSCISDILLLIRFFFPEITASNYYHYDRLSKFMSEITVSQYIYFVVQTMHATDMISNGQPSGKIINSHDTGLTVEEVLQEINVTNKKKS